MRQSGRGTEVSVWRVPVSVLAIGLAATAPATAQFASVFEAKDRERFEHSVSSTLDTLADRLDIYTSMLRGGKGLFDSDGCSPRVWHLRGPC